MRKKICASGQKPEAAEGFEQLSNLEPHFLRDIDEAFLNNFIVTR
ncbi:hypothetical protein [Chryseolinea lacunae]|nr:hypothetical protein [Chryseolinea lacunae]